MFIQTDLSYLKQNIEDIENTVFNLLNGTDMEIYIICESGELIYPIGFRSKEQAEATIKTSKNRGLYVDKIKVVDEIIDLDTIYP